jgi:hypothetical protein
VVGNAVGQCGSDGLLAICHNVETKAACYTQAMAVEDYKPFRRFKPDTVVVFAILTSIRVFFINN